MTTTYSDEVVAKKNVLARHRFFMAMANGFTAQFKQGQRRGQAWMNALAVEAPSIWLEITGTEADCFSDDSRVPAFSDKVFKERMTSYAHY